MSGMFNMSITQGVKEGGKFLQAGIHDATFKGIEKQSFDGKDGVTYTTLAIIFDVDGFGELSHRLFEPTSNERSEGMYGLNPSQLEQFMLTNRHLLDTANPTISKGIDEGTITIDAPSFDAFIKKMQEFTKDFIGKKTQIKLLPQKSGFNQLPGFPARINKQGALYLSTRFIGDDLTLTSAEIVAIDKVKNAKPTNMKNNSAKTGADTDINDMMGDFDGSDADDLPF